MHKVFILIACSNDNILEVWDLIKCFNSSTFTCFSLFLKSLLGNYVGGYCCWTLLEGTDLKLLVPLNIQWKPDTPRSCPTVRPARPTLCEVLESASGGVGGRERWPHSFVSLPNGHTEEFLQPGDRETEKWPIFYVNHTSYFGQGPLV